MLKLLIDVQRKTVITQTAQCDEKQPTHIFENLFSSCRRFTIVDFVYRLPKAETQLHKRCYYSQRKLYIAMQIPAS